MTDKEAIAIIRKEILCVSRDCDIERSCGSCDLVMPDREPIIEAYKMAIEALENQKTGHWVEKNINQDGTHNIYCSNCNNYQKFKGHANSYNARTKLKYCPNCGAKMEGE